MLMKLKLTANIRHDAMSERDSSNSSSVNLNKYKLLVYVCLCVCERADKAFTST